VFRTLALGKKVFPPHMFPFAIDGGGNLLLADCATPEAAVYIWWHDVSENSLVATGVGIADFWSLVVDA